MVPAKPTPPISARGLSPSAASSAETTGSSPGAAAAYASSVREDLLRVAEGACRWRWGISEDARPFRCAERMPSAQPQTPYVSLPQSKSEQHDEDEEIDEREQRVLLHGPQIVHG